MNASHRTPSTCNLEIKDNVLWCRGHHQAEPSGLHSSGGESCKVLNYDNFIEALRPLFPLLLLSYTVPILLSLICSNPKNYLSTMHLL